MPQQTIIKICSKCKQEKFVSEFYIRPDAPHCFRSHCKECMSNKASEYHFTPSGKVVLRRARVRFSQTERGKIYQRNGAKKYQRRYPERKRAGAAVARALKHGILIRPDKCSKCEKFCIPDAHHYLGYEKDHYLHVQWLCRVCHAKEDS